ncbi:hypothetical protein E8E12_006589 [Didymella heteroderae]|uniref:Uncharacterized protein n=1 Tax=Didymella heteroderae TaxID=1769908 RepID=A0A9P4WNZ0_9PLEO|nr:hypothetical protein E8E12_006589 [Didymella heteroderae]
MAELELSTVWSRSYKDDPSRISLLDLPRELRDIIYAYAFHVTGAIFIYNTDPYQPQPKLRSKIVRYRGFGAADPIGVHEQVSIGLLRSCRQLHAECAPVLYGDNTFRIWLLGKANLTPTYRQLVRYSTLTTEAAYRIFNTRDLDTTSHGWRNRFWPAILDSGGKMLTQFPNVESITVPMKSGAESSTWRPAFFDLGGRTADRRIELAAEWMLERTRFPDERLRDCLHLELEPSPGSISREEYAGSRFAPDEEEWDHTEFANAFELMKALD